MNTLPRDYAALLQGEREPRTLAHSMFKSHREEKE